MMRQFQLFYKKGGWVAFALVMTAILSFWAIGALPGWVGWAVALPLWLAVWGVAAWYYTRERHAWHQKWAKDEQQLETLQGRLQDVETQYTLVERRLQTVLAFNRSLMNAHDEQALMDLALSGLNDLTGALGCSFVPVDEWDQPLPPFTNGRLPEPVLRAWAEHLTGIGLRERCGACKVLESTAGHCPMHPEALGDSLTVYCLPLERPAGALPSRRLGILHLYLPKGILLDLPTRTFLESLLQEIALAIETVRWREQELTTLRQLQQLHAPQNGLKESLDGLLDSLYRALELDFVWLRLRPSQDDRLSGLNIQQGTPPDGLLPQVEALLARALTGELQQFDLPDAAVAMLALPMRLPEGGIPGALLIGSSRAQAFHPRQQAILQTVAAQAALLVENERMLRSLEYKAVIQERTRLAREIHDGLAQTLAFLKLQAAQMQSYLDKGDLLRLGQVLKDNYQALAEAYLDTRQAIDNLRLTPRADLYDWLERVIADFEAANNLAVERHIQAIPPSWQTALTPEIQAQLLRIVQESLNNVRKHAHATHASVRLLEWQEDLVLEVSDDGQGFDTADVPEISRHGLRGMRERADLMGAEFQITSQPRSGTVVRLALPAYWKEESR